MHIKNKEPGLGKETPNLGVERGMYKGSLGPLVVWESKEYFTKYDGHMSQGYRSQLWGCPVAKSRTSWEPK